MKLRVVSNVIFHQSPNRCVFQLCLTFAVSLLGPPVDGLLKGMGCDGIDNNCDPLKKIDECEEDNYVSRFTNHYQQS